MNCITDGMMWFDWVSVALLYCLGIWKTIELINKFGKKVDEWIYRQ